MASSEVPELRIILLGKNSSEISRVGNFILGRDTFNTEAPPRSVEQYSERARGDVEGRYITLINTPHLFNPQLTVTQLTHKVKECMSLCAPGPHAIVLVLQPDDFTETDRHRLKHIHSSLFLETHKQTLVLTTQKVQSGPSVDGEENVSQKIITECNNRLFEFNSECSRSAIVKLMEKLEKLVEENGGRHLKTDEYVEAPHAREKHHEQTARREFEESVWKKKTVPLKYEVKSKDKLSEKLNLILCGRDEAVKSSIAVLILGQRECSTESSSVCVRREREVCGCLVTLVEMPALYNTQLSEEEVMKETYRCVSLCDPGVHVFLFIIPDGHLTDEDKEEIEKMQRIFGSTFNNYTMFLITTQSQQEAKFNDAAKDITKTYSGHVCTLGTNENSVLLQRVEEVVMQNRGRCYTTAMYLDAQVETQLKYKLEIEELQNTISFLRREKNRAQESCPGTGDLRIVLLGKTGVGKSAAGNTIMGKKVFQEVLSTQSGTSLCQKVSGEVRGRQITVIDTPGLFDTSISNVEIRKEIAKCISMAAPGLHVFLLVLTVGRFTQEEHEAVKMIQDLFGEESKKYTMVLFTRGDDLQGMTIEDFITNSNRSFQNIINQCDNRYHVFNNRSPENRIQVTALLEKIDSMVTVNGGSCYTNQMFQQVEEALQEQQERILIENKNEMEKQKEELRAKHEAEMEKITKVMEEEMRKLDREKRENEEEFLRREAQIKKEINKELKEEMVNKLNEQQEVFKQEIERKDQVYKKQIQWNLQKQEEKYEREKEDIKEQAEKKARQQAEEEFCVELDKQVAKAKEDGYEQGKSEFESKQTYAGKLAGVGSRIGLVFPFRVLGGTFGGCIGGIVDSFIMVKNIAKFKLKRDGKTHD